MRIILKSKKPFCLCFSVCPLCSEAKKEELYKKYPFSLFFLLAETSFYSTTSHSHSHINSLCDITKNSRAKDSKAPLRICEREEITSDIRHRKEDGKKKNNQMPQFFNGCSSKVTQNTTEILKNCHFYELSSKFLLWSTIVISFYLPFLLLLRTSRSLSKNTFSLCYVLCKH